MTEQEPEGTGVDRRAFLKRMAVGGFAIPVIATFQLDSLARASGLHKFPDHGYGNQTDPDHRFGNQTDPDHGYGNQTYPNQTFPNQNREPCDPGQKFPNQTYGNQTFQTFPNQSFGNQTFPFLPHGFPVPELPPWFPRPSAWLP
jgi:hypothetical protein